MLKNVIVTSVAFMFLFTAFQSMAVLQNSLYPTSDGGLGTWSLSTVYVGLIIGSLLLPTFIINRVTIKYTIFVAMFGYVLYICGQFYPEFYTLVPAAFITGLCASCLWSAKCTYLTILGHEYGRLTGQDSEVVIVRFFGIFFFFFQSASVWGNLISSLVLGSGQSKEGNDPEICGVNYCPSTDLKNATLNKDDDDDKTTLYVLAGIYLGCAVAAAIIIFTLLDPLHRYGEKKREGSPVELILATAKQMKHPYQILLIPLTIWSGMEQGFWGADFTAVNT
ncbi:unnamed protein product [Allacma fusca]|uniref:UNC93-like protein n=2 Tax=Allacma fusca TaxID=39272 RepID=A0A8J2LQX7_9HEXA|nr:unnamed protein product [Allacma fusca]